MSDGHLGKPRELIIIPTRSFFINLKFSQMFSKCIKYLSKSFFKERESFKK